MTDRELVDLLERSGWIGPALCDALRRMAGFRNLLVHGYSEVDPGIVQDAAENRLGDPEAFVAAVRPRI